MRFHHRLILPVALLALLWAAPGCGIIITNVALLVATQVEPEEVVEEEAAPGSTQVYAVVPSNGVLAGGTFVSIYGMNFGTGSATVDFGTSPATNVTVVSPTVITCTTPAGAAQGPVTVTVNGPAGGGSLGQGFTYSDWFYDGWPSRQPVIVTGTGSAALADYQVQVTIPYDADMAADFSDLRFTTSDGTYESATGFWVESVTASTSATVWVKVPSIPASGGTVTVYVYFGNAAAGSASDFDATFTKSVDTTSLAGHWHFDEGQGTSAADASTNGNDAVLLDFNAPEGWQVADGGQWADRSDAGFTQGSHLSLDGADDQLDAGSGASLNPATAITVEAWARSNKAQMPGVQQVVASQWSVDNAYKALQSWDFYDAVTNAPNAAGGYKGYVFDGRYLYFTPERNSAGWHGEILRFDTRGDFNASASWTAYDPGYGTDGTDGLDATLSMDIDGYCGGVFDGQYIYFCPLHNGTDYHGAVLRHDTQATGGFAAPASWAAFDPSTPESDDWVTGANDPLPRRYHVGASASGKFYSMGGEAGIGWRAETYSYDPSSDTWVQTAFMPQPGGAFGAATWNDRIYVMGGYDGTYADETFEYDPVADTWAIKTVMPTARWFLSAAAIDGKIYAVGGTSGSTSYEDAVEMYDVATDTWTIAANLPTGRNRVTCAALNGYVYCIGGSQSGTTYLSRVDRYDPSRDTWEQVASLPAARYYMVSCVIDGKIYATGGYNGGYRSNTYCYDPVEDLWTEKSAMPTARYYHAGAALDGKFHVVGGSSTVSNPDDVLEIYDPTKDYVGADPDGYHGACFDGRHVYFAPYHNGSNYHGEVLRFDTQGNFLDRTDWDTIQLHRHNIGNEERGYAGIFFDGTYVYLVPYRDSAERHGEVMRYDTRGAFRDPANWKAYDPGYGTDGTDGLDALLGMDLDGFVNCGFDGRHLYFTQYRSQAGVEGGDILRYDTHGDFGSLTSWTAYNPGLAGLNGATYDLRGFRGAVFDGRYMHFCPSDVNGTAVGAWMRFDTRGDFTDLSAWTAYDPGADGLGLDLNGYYGCAFDGRYVYGIPNRAFSGAYSARVTRYDTTSHHAAYALNFSQNACNGGTGTNAFGPGVTVNTTGGLTTLTSNAALAPGGWHHLAFTYDGSDLSLFVDGAQAATASATGTLYTTNGNFTLGNLWEGNAFLDGDLDEVRVWSRALTLEEIQAHYQRRVYAADAPTVGTPGTKETR